MTLPPDTAPRSGGEGRSRLVYGLLVVPVVLPTLVLLVVFGWMLFVMTLAAVAANIASPAQWLGGELPVAIAIAGSIACGTVAFVLFVLHSVRYVLGGRGALAGRRRALWRMHAIAVPAFALSFVLSRELLADSPFEPSALLFALALSGLPVLPFSFFLLAQSTPREG